MSIDIYKLSNGQPTDLLLSINNLEYGKLLPTFEVYERKTGLSIDQFSDLKLSSGVRPLIESLEEYGKQSTIGRSLMAVLEQAEENSYGIVFIGD